MRFLVSSSFMTVVCTASRMSWRGDAATHSRQVDVSCPPSALKCLKRGKRWKNPPPEKGKPKVRLLFPSPASPLPPPSVRGAPRALCSPIPRSRCPFLLPLPRGGAAALPTSLSLGDRGSFGCTARVRTVPLSWYGLWFWLGQGVFCIPLGR